MKLGGDMWLVDSGSSILSVFQGYIGHHCNYMIV